MRNPYKIAATTIESLRGLFRDALDREPTLEEIVDMLEEIADHDDPLTGWVSRLEIMDRIIRASKVRT